MSKGVKILLGAVAVLALVIGAIAVFLVSNLDGLVRDVIESVGTEVVGAPVKVDGVRIELKQGRGTISGISIANPRGFPAGNAFELKRIELALDLANLTRDLIAIDSIAVTGAAINAIQDPAGNNLQALLNNIRGSGSDASEPGSSDSVAPKLSIGEFRFEEASVSVSLPAANLSRTAKIPDVILRNIGSKSGGVTAAEAARQILEPLTRRALEASTGVSTEQLEQRARDEAGKALERGQERLKEKLGGLLDR